MSDEWKKQSSKDWKNKRADYYPEYSDDDEEAPQFDLPEQDIQNDYEDYDDWYDQVDWEN